MKYKNLKRCIFLCDQIKQTKQMISYLALDSVVVKVVLPICNTEVVLPMNEIGDKNDIAKNFIESLQIHYKSNLQELEDELAKL